MNLKRALFLLLALALAPVAAAAQEPHRLTLREAIEAGLKNNLRVLVAGTQVEEAGGTRQRRLAALLPVARGESYANLQNRNLRAFGIEFPGVPDTVGPFSNYDFRVSFEQPLLDLRSYHRWQASQRQEQAARHSYQDVRDLIIRQVAALYLNALAGRARSRPQPGEPRAGFSIQFQPLLQSPRLSGGPPPAYGADRSRRSGAGLAPAGRVRAAAAQRRGG